MADDQPQMGGKGKITAILVSLVAITGLLVTLLGNIDGIVKNVENLFGYHPRPSPSTPTAPSSPAPISQTPAPQTPPPQVAAPAPALKKVIKVCMGTGGGENCLNGADAKYDCNTYNAFGGGGPQTYSVLADMFCSYTDGGARKIYPHDIIVIQNNGGGQCGWTAFQVTCNP